MTRTFASRASALHGDLRECLLLPAIAVLLPWRLAFRVLRALAAKGFAFRRETERALATCRTLGFVDDADAWQRAHATMRVVDHVDPVLSFFRGDRYLDRHAIVDAESLPPGPCIFIGFHYGTGFWTLRHLRRRGYRAAFLAVRVTARQCPGAPLRLAFMRFRKRCVERAGAAPVIFVGGSRERIAAALRDGTSVVGLIDVPDITHAMPVQFLGHDVRWPDGLLRIAEAERVPVVAFVASLDPHTGARRIRFRTMPAERASAMNALAAMLGEAIAHDSSAWHLWGEWMRFLPERDPARAAGAKVEVG
jgi:phosphatidylinositol dimannoside acyltransferase